jgi:hypothetical protein
MLAHAVALSSVVASVLADEDEDQMKSLIDDAGPIAMAFIVLLGVALFFLWRSMNKQLKRIDPALPEEEPAEPVIPEDPDGPTASGPDDDVAPRP